MADNYFAPYIDESGLHIPTYNAILNYLLDSAKKIFGQDIYVGTDSADYQMISVFSLSLYEAMQTLQYSYNQTSPNTAVGAGLSSLVRLNGLLRRPPTYSTCDVVLTGTSAAIIINGVVTDVSGYKWDLPTPITLQAAGSPVGSSYSLTVTATCQTIGAINAQIGDISSISTPVAGWTSVENLVAATPGTAAETDAELRERQAVSTALPSQTMLEGTIAGIISILGVTRYKVYENPTNSTTYGDAGVPFEGAPVHSITCVVEGGEIADIAQIIYENRGLGCYVNGDVETDITDDYGNITTIRFYRPTYVPIYVEIAITELVGYTDDTEDDIKEAIADYINSLSIGEPLVWSSVMYAAVSVMTRQAKPTFSISSLKIGKTASPTGTSDIVMNYNEVAQGDEDYIIATVS